MATTRIKNQFLPQGEGNFNAYVGNFARQLTAHRKDYFLSEGQIDNLNVHVAEWDQGYAAAIAARDAAKAAVRTKDVLRVKVDEIVRDLARRIQANSDVSDAAREDAGLPVRKTTRTPVTTPKTAPTGNVLATDRLEHTLTYSDSSTPTRRARPHGVQGCEVYVAVNDVAPTDPEAYRFVAFSTRTPDRVQFKAEDGGKTANYLLRWVNTKGDHGPWSQIISATIPAV